jgi:hypothetical protein
VLHELLRHRTIPSLLSVVLLLSPLVTVAQPKAEAPAKSNQSMVVAGREGAALGETLRLGAPRPTYNQEQGVIVIPGVDRIQLEQLTGVSEEDAAAARVRLGALNGASTDELDEAGAQAVRQLETDPSLTGDVHRLLRSQDEEGYSAIDQDPALQESREILSSLTTVRERSGGTEDIATSALSSYSDCGVGVTIRPGSNASAGEISYEVCEFLRERPDVIRERRVEIATRPIEMDPYLNPLVVRDITVPVTLPVPQNALSFEFDHTWTGTVANVELLEEPVEGNGFQARFRVIHNGEACAGVPPDEPCAGRSQSVSIRFVGSFTRLEEELVCSEENCLLDSDGFASADWRCLDDDPRTIGEVVIDSSFPGLEPLFPDSTGLCWRAESRYQHHYAEGEICWDSPTGEQCFDQEQPVSGTNTCPRIAQLTAGGNISCRPTQRNCAEDGAGHNGFCYVESVGHTCATRVRFQNIRVDTTNNCATSMSCMGAECAPRLQQEIANAGNVDMASYGRQQAYGLLVHHILNDYTPKPNQTPPALIFDGRPSECRKALGGATDCCIAEVPGAQTLWFDLYTRAQRQQHALTAHALAPTMPGTAVSLAGGFVSSDVLNKPFISDRETIAGGPTASLSGTSGGMSIPDILPEFLRLAKNQLQLSGGAHCSANEFDLAALRSIGACSLVGTRCVGIGCLDKRDVYCCMNSPVSKNAREVMGAGDFGSARNPTCAGVTLEQVRSANWTGSNLDDLVARLSRVGLLPGPDTLLAQTSQESVTGSGSTLAGLTVARQSVGQRSAQALDSFNDRAVAASLESQARAELPGAATPVRHAGVLEWSPGFATVRGDEEGALAVRRLGSEGRVSVSWSTRPLTAVQGRDFDTQSGVLMWEAGDTEPKPVVVRAKRTAQTGTPTMPIEFQVVLSAPTNGAMVGAHGTAIVRIAAPHREPPNPLRPTLRITKRAIQSGVSPEIGTQPMILWEIAVTNRSTEFEAFVSVVDELASAHIAEWVQCPGLPEAGASQNPTCSNITVPRGHTAILHLRTTALGSGTWGSSITNRCSVTGVWRSAPGSVWGGLSRGHVENECQASASYPSTPPPPPPPACLSAGPLAPASVTGYTVTWNDLFASGPFPSFSVAAPIGSFSLDRTLEGPMSDQFYITFPIQLEANKRYGLRHSQSTHIEQGPPGQPTPWYPGGRSRRGTTFVSISPCKGDLRPQSITSSDPFVRLCRGMHYDSTLFFGTRGQFHECNLVPGETYWVTYAMVDPGQPTTPFRRSCALPHFERCEVVVDLVEE